MDKTGNDVFSMAMINLPTMPSLANIFIYLQDLDSFQALLLKIRNFLRTQATTSKKKIFLTKLVVEWVETNAAEYSHIIELLDRHADDDNIAEMPESLKVSTLFDKLLDPDDDIATFDLFELGEEVGFHNDSPMSVAGLLERMIKMSHMTTSILESRNHVICLLLDITLVLLTGKKITSISNLEGIYQEELKKSKPNELYKYLINHNDLKNDNTLALLFDLIIDDIGINSYIEESREAAILLALISVTDSKNWQDVLIKFKIVLKNKRADALILKLFVLLSNHCLSGSRNIDYIAVSELFRFLITFIPESIMQSRQRNEFLHQDLGAGSLAQCIFSIYKTLIDLDNSEQTIAIFKQAVSTLIGNGDNLLSAAPENCEIVTQQPAIQIPLILPPAVPTIKLNQDRTPFQTQPSLTVPPTVAPARARNIPRLSTFQPHVPEWLLNPAVLLPFGASVMFVSVWVFNPYNLGTKALNMLPISQNSEFKLPTNNVIALDSEEGAHFVSCYDLKNDLGSICFVALSNVDLWGDTKNMKEGELRSIISRPGNEAINRVVKAAEKHSPKPPKDNNFVFGQGFLIIAVYDPNKFDDVNAAFATLLPNLLKKPSGERLVIKNSKGEEFEVLPKL